MGYEGDQAKIAGYKIEKLNETMRRVQLDLELNNMLKLCEIGLLSTDDIKNSSQYNNIKAELEVNKQLKKRF